MSDDRFERINAEIERLREGGQLAELAADATPRPAVIYRDVPCLLGASYPKQKDVLVPVPDGYPAGHIDGAALLAGDELFGRLAGGTNPQGNFAADDKQWVLASYHPHQGGGGPAWDPTRHGYHTYLDHLVAWLAVLK
jgi:hypothetical protein